MKIIYFTHSLASCWNHGNAHFLRGVLRELAALGHHVRALEPQGAWSLENLLRDHGAANVALAESWQEALGHGHSGIALVVLGHNGQMGTVVHTLRQPACEGNPPRVRVIGDAPEELYGDISTAVFDGPALIDGRRELLPYLLEQSVSATLHRFGVIQDPAGIRD